MLSIGGPAAARVVNAGIHPLKRPQAGDIPVLPLRELQQVLGGEPPPWLARSSAAPRPFPLHQRFQWALRSWPKRE